MWLIITAFAAIIATIIWFKTPQDKYKLSILSLMLWGATLMWLIDHVIAYFNEGGNFLEINMDATLLGLSVIALAIVVWFIILLISRPKGIFKHVSYEK